MRLPATTLAVFATVIATALSVAATAAPTEGADTSPTLVRPAKDPFYTYDGDKPLSQIPAGTPLKTRDVTLAADTNGTPLPAEQILYRTTTRPAARSRR